MAARKEIRLQHAQLLFVKEGLSQKDVAQRVGVTEKTVGRWVKIYKWNDLKRSFAATRHSIIANLQKQLELLQGEIKKRENGMATTKETDMLVKLATAIKKLENETGAGETVEVAMKFIRFVAANDTSLAQLITRHFDAYIQTLLS